MADYTRRRFLQTVLVGTAAGTQAGPLLAWQGQVRTIAGTGVPGYEPEGEAGLPGSRTPVNNPYGIVVGPDGALYFCEVDTGRTRRMDLNTGRLTTIAGDGEKVYRGDGEPAPVASFSAPHEIRFDQEDNLFVVERDAHVVRRIDARTRVVSTVAGTGEEGFSGDGGPASEAQLRQPHSIAFDSDGNLLVCDIGNSRVRHVNMGTDGVPLTVEGGGSGESPC